MARRFGVAVVAVVSGALSFVGPAAHAAWHFYDVRVDLGTLGGATSEAVAITDDGAVVGWAQASDGTRHTVRWAGYDLSIEPVAGVPDGVVVEAVSHTGHTMAWASGTHVTVWRDGAVDDVGTPPNAGYVRVKGVNDAGDVVGDFSPPIPPRFAPTYGFVYRDGAFSVLGCRVSCFGSTSAYGITDDGRAFGGHSSVETIGPFVDDNGLEVPIPGTPDYPSGYVSAVSPHGFAAAWLFSILDSRQSVIAGWKPVVPDVGTWQPTPITNQYSAARAVNDNGLLVGQWNGRPFVASFGNVAVPGVGVVPAVGAATAINDDNLVVGWDETNGLHHAVLWRPGTQCANCGP